MTRVSYNAFRQAARLTREPCEPRDRLMHAAIINALVVPESLANAAFFAVGNPLGPLGGWLISLGIAALNVFLATSFGGVLRYVNHVSIVHRLWAWGVTAFYATFLVAFHLGVAHWRNALGGLVLNVKPGEAGQAALAALLQFPFQLQTLDAWGLVILGILFAQLAVAAAYRAADPYPGYGTIAARYRDAANALKARKDEYLIGLNAIFAGAEERIKAIRLNALDALAQHRASAAATVRIRLHYEAYVSQVNASAEYSTSLYRTVNRAVRVDSEPPYFSMPRRPLPGVKVLELKTYNVPSVDEAAMHSNLSALAADAKRKIRELQGRYLREAPALFASLTTDPQAGDEAGRANGAASPSAAAPRLVHDGKLMAKTEPEVAVDFQAPIAEARAR